MLSHGEHGLGDLAALSHNHPFHDSRHHHRHHHEYLLWALITGMLSYIAVKLGFKVFKHCRHRHHCSKLPTLASQLSELSSQCDAFPNPLLANARATTAVQVQGGVIPKSEPDWMGNVPWSDWQIDQEDILLCKRPDGRLWELGSGASAKVPHAVLTVLCSGLLFASDLLCSIACMLRAKAYCPKIVGPYKPYWHAICSLFS